MWFYFWRFNFCNFSRVGWFSWCRGEATRGSELLGIARQWPRGCGRSRLLPSKWILLVSPIASVAKIGVHAGVGVPLMLLNTCRAYSVHLWGSKHGPCNFSKAPALVSAGTQVEVMLLGGQGLSGLRGSDQAVLGICCPERVMFQAQGGPTLSKGRSYFWRLSPCNSAELEAVALASPGRPVFQVEGTLLDGQSLSGLRRSDQGDRHLLCEAGWVPSRSWSYLVLPKLHECSMNFLKEFKPLSFQVGAILLWRLSLFNFSRSGGRCFGFLGKLDFQVEVLLLEGPRLSGLRGRAPADLDISCPAGCFSDTGLGPKWRWSHLMVPNTCHEHAMPLLLELKPLLWPPQAGSQHVQSWHCQAVTEQIWCEILLGVALFASRDISLGPKRPTLAKWIRQDFFKSELKSRGWSYSWRLRFGISAELEAVDLASAGKLGPAVTTWCWPYCFSDTGLGSSSVIDLQSAQGCGHLAVNALHKPIGSSFASDKE